MKRYACCQNSRLVRIFKDLLSAISARGVIHLVRTRRIGRSSKSVHHAYKEGGGLAHLSTYTKVAVCTYFVIFSYARYFYHTLLSLSSTFIIFFVKHLLSLFFSLKCFTAFFSMRLLIGCLKDSR